MTTSLSPPSLSCTPRSCDRDRCCFPFRKETNKQKRNGLHTWRFKTTRKPNREKRQTQSITIKCPQQRNGEGRPLLCVGKPAADSGCLISEGTPPLQHLSGHKKVRYMLAAQNAAVASSQNTNEIKRQQDKMTHCARPGSRRTRRLSKRFPRSPRPAGRSPAQTG